MSKFNTAQMRTQVHAPITATRVAGQTTYEGAPAFARDARSELFVLAVSNMVSENTFYEKATDRDERFASLVAQVAVADPEWMAGFVPWLRSGANMRSASLVAAMEAARAMIAAKIPGGRALIDTACQRADEPAEALAYWLAHYGRALPMPVKRGIADASRRLYNERSALKYDVGTHAGTGKVYMADVLELCHTKGGRVWRDELYTYLLDRRPGAKRKVGGKRVPIGEHLPIIAATRRTRTTAQTDATVMAESDTLADTGVTWEEQLSTAGAKVDKAALWEAKIPTMGYMALLRNLRGFDQAGVSDTVAAWVADRLADPEEVARSRQFPFRFLSAWKAVPSMRWAPALETALGHSLANVPALAGRSLILVDRSASMFQAVSGRSQVQLAEIAAIFGSALALRAEHARLVQYGTHSQVVKFAPGVGSLLRVAERFGNLGGTNTTAAVAAHYAGHDRVIIITDEQATGYWGYSRYGYATPGEQVPAHVPVYTWNLAGYRHGHEQAGSGRRYTFAGLTDQAWGAIELLESGHDGRWPWQ